MNKDFAEIIYRALDKNKQNFNDINYMKLCFIKRYFPNGENMLNQLNTEEAIKGYVSIIIEEELKKFEDLIHEFQGKFNELLYQ